MEMKDVLLAEQIQYDQYQDYQNNGVELQWYDAQYEGDTRKVLKLDVLEEEAYDPIIDFLESLPTVSVQADTVIPTKRDKPSHTNG